MADVEKPGRGPQTTVASPPPTITAAEAAAAPAMANPPATMEQIEEHDSADRARAALGGSPVQPVEEPEPEAVDEEEEPAGPAAGRWTPQAGLEPPTRASRFQPPPELEFEFTPPAAQPLRNNNVPLTIGLLFSIVASFVVFFVSLGGATAGEDPIMPAFWRGLATLAVLITLSFAASWFMPAPHDRRQLLDQLDVQDRILGRHEEVTRVQAERAVEPEFEPQTAPATGTSVDLMVDDDDGLEDELGLPAGQQDYYDDFDDDEEEEDLLASPNPTAPAAGGTA
ncbi:MAG TPA: hypothetical protein VF157_02365 [Chloroflexota bacterium]